MDGSIYTYSKILQYADGEVIINRGAVQSNDNANSLAKNAHFARSWITIAANPIPGNVEC